MESTHKLRSSVCGAPDTPHGSELCFSKAASFSEEEIKRQTRHTSPKWKSIILFIIQFGSQIESEFDYACKTTNLQEACRSAETTGKTVGMPSAIPRDETSIEQRTLYPKQTCCQEKEETEGDLRIKRSLRNIGQSKMWVQ